MGFWLLLRTLGPAQAACSTLTGLVHGLAGSAAVALLLAPLEPTRYAGHIAPRPLLMVNGAGEHVQ